MVAPLLVLQGIKAATKKAMLLFRSVAFWPRSRYAICRRPR
ncbi:hypothetical protein [Moorena sp. SIO1F2]|nr:hypothetical protein [Moorena sp. SIO1F2]